MKPTILALARRNEEQGMDGDWILPSGKLLVFGALPWDANDPNVSSIPYCKTDFQLVVSRKRTKKAIEAHVAELVGLSPEDRAKAEEKLEVRVYQEYDSTPDDGFDDTSGRVAIQVHTGTYYGDTRKGWRSDVLGCFILGMGLGHDKATSQKILLRSRDAYDIFMKEMGGQDWTLDFGAAV